MNLAERIDALLPEWRRRFVSAVLISSALLLMFLALLVIMSVIAWFAKP